MTKTRSARTHHSPVPTCCAVVLPWDGAGHQNRSTEAQLAWQGTDEAIQMTVQMNPDDWARFGRQRLRPCRPNNATLAAADLPRAGCER